MSGIALVLAGHGSHISANTAGVVWDVVDRLRQFGVADEVTACFWKEAPAFSQVLDTVEADDIVVVPLFAARGYFTSEVLPSEMGLSGPVTRMGKRWIHLTPTIGEHHMLDSIVDQRLRNMIEYFDLPAQDTAIAVIGHGTRRNRQSRDTARTQAERIRAAGLATEVVAVYLDDDPDIPSIYRSTRSRHIIALPYFLADGSHVAIDLPGALGIAGTGAAERVNGRSVFFAEPVGDNDSLSDIVLALARDTGLPFAPQPVESPWAGCPRAGRRALIQSLEAERILRFGQLWVSKERVWHTASKGDSPPIATPSALRLRVREQPFRPLATSNDLPAGWHVDLHQPEDGHAVIETVYPGLVADWATLKDSRLATEPLQVISARQFGMFKDIHRLSSAIIQNTIDKVCGACIRQPTWWSGLVADTGALPCRSACNLWLSTAQKTGDAQ